MNRISSRRRRLQNAFLISALALCAAKAFAVEVEGPAPRSGPAPVIAPAASQLPALSVQIEAALKPSASIEASGAAGLDIATIMQGGQARPAEAVPAAPEPSVMGAGLPSLPASQVHAAVVSETITPLPARRTKPTENEPGARVLHAAALLVFLAASALSWYVFIHSVGEIARVGEQQLQEQLHDPELGNNPF